VERTRRISECERKYSLERGEWGPGTKRRGESDVKMKKKWIRPGVMDLITGERVRMQVGRSSETVAGGGEMTITRKEGIKEVMFEGRSRRKEVKDREG